MLFKINSSTFLAVIAPLARILSVKSVNPVLESIGFVLKEDQLSAFASDTDITIRTVLPLQEAGEGSGFFRVPGRQLHELLRQMPSDETLTITINADNVALHWSNGRARIPAYADPIPEVTFSEDGSLQLSLPQNELLKGIEDTVGSVSEEELRPVMTGVLFDFGKENTTLVSSDCKRLVMHELEGYGTEQPLSFIVHGRNMELLKLFLEDGDGNVDIRVNRTTALFTTPSGATITTMLIPGKYPQYRSIIPSNNDNILEADKVTLEKSIKRITSCTACKGDKFVKFEFDADGQVTVSAQDLGLNTSAKETLQDCTYNGTSFKTGFKADMLLALLSTLNCKRIALKFRGERNAALVVPCTKNALFTGLAMPIYVS